MAIAKVKSFELLAPQAYKDELLHHFQIFRNIEFKEEDLDEEILSKMTSNIDRVELDKIDDVLTNTRSVIELVSRYMPTTGSLKSFMAGVPNLTFEELERRAKAFDLEKNYNEVRDLGRKLDQIEIQLVKGRELIDEISSFSAFDVDERLINSLRYVIPVVGAVPTKLVTLFEEKMRSLDEVHIEPIGIRKEEKLYLVLFHKDNGIDMEEEFREVSFSRTKLDLSSIPREREAELRTEQESLRKLRDEIIEKILKYGEVLEDMKISYEYYDNLRVRYEEGEKLLKTSKIVIISGYILEDEQEEFLSIIERETNGINAITISDVDRDSADVPIMLKNNSFVRNFEGITASYALPKYNEIDPTPFFAIVYSIFFGMMVADAAYGIILFIVTSFALLKCNLSPSMKHSIKFFRIISVPTIIWGVLYGSYFGEPIPGMWKLIDPGKDFMIIMLLAIAMGIAHIFYGLGIKAYMLMRDKKPIDTFFETVCWYVTLLGAILYMYTYFTKGNPVLGTYGAYTVLIGLILIFIGGTRHAEGGGIVAKFGAGFFNVYGISGYVGDVVSYSRLMALGLSGGFIAHAINVIAGLLFASPVGYVFGILVLILCHTFNLFLSCLGSYVHSLRLTYVEFFSKFYEGGGRAFKVFRNVSTYINLDRKYQD